MLLPPPGRVLTSRLVLSPWRAADAALLKEAVDGSLSHLRPWMPWAREEPLSLAAQADLIAGFEQAFTAGRDFIYGLLDPQERRALGGSGLHPRRGPEELEIGYWLRVGATGRGLATEAAAALTRVAFEAALAAAVEIRCDPRNRASSRVPQRLGYCLVATVPWEGDDPFGRKETSVYRMERVAFATSPAAAVARQARWETPGGRGGSA